MAITLAEAKVGMADKIDQMVIDEFRRSSLLLDRLTFDDSVSPGTGGSTLVYGYIQLQTPSTAAFRALNSEYTTNEAKRTKQAAELKIFGGKFTVDRVVQRTSGAVDEINFQLQQKILGAKNLFCYTVINGDSETNTDEFDGLDTMLTGKSTEFNASGTAIDLSSTSALDSNYKAFLDTLNLWLSSLDGKPDILMGNSAFLSRIKSVAQRAGYYSRSEDAFGRTVDNYDGIQLQDMGNFYNGTATVSCVPTYSATIGESTVTGLTDLYAAKLGLDAFHAASPLGAGNLINTYLPDLNAPGALKIGEVEMVAAVALKNSLKAGVLRRVKVS